ncbi:MAG: ribbon-helix-helix protein, CopG family [Myxococcaceae bacterium]|nr:ribbon-helix-helix protein, CopG family [Myxococcaceae bacterium]
MHQVIIELDDATITRLNKVAPARARKRSEFIREAIRRALNEVLERDMERAYREQPDRRAEPAFDAETWEPAPKRRRRGR